MRIVARLLVLLPLLWVEGVWAVDCASANYVFNSQAEVDALGATGCDRVSGYLYISGFASSSDSGNSDDITNLDGLANITSVGDSLSIENNAALTNLDGLASLASVGDAPINRGVNDCVSDFGSDASNCDSWLRDMPGVNIENNDALTNLDGLANLTSVGGELIIRSNAALTNLDGLWNLTSIGDELIIRSNAALTNLDGLASLTSVGDKLSITGNAALTNLDGLANLSGGIGGSLNIQNNDALTNLDGLANITGVGGYLSIENNDALTNLDGLANITSVGLSFGLSLNIQNNDALTNLDGLASLTSVRGHLFIRWNAALTNLDGLASLTSVGDDLRIIENAALTNLDGLANLTSVDRVNIQSNAALTNLNGLANLTSFEGPLRIFDNNALTNLDGLASLTSVGDHLSIEYNAALTNLDGLASLTSVGGQLAIDSNNALTNLDGLANITSVGLLWIGSNPNASCEGVAPLLGWPNGPPDDNVDGTIEIFGNGIGCDSIEEILASVSGPTQPVINQATTSGTSISLSFTPSRTTDTLFPITSYEAICATAADLSEAPASELLDNVPVQSTLTASGGAMSYIEIDINITHDRPEHLYITLTTPQGTELILWDRAGAGTEDIAGTFPTTLTPIDTLSGIDGQSMEGDWVLYVEDIVVGPLVKEGVLNSWGLRITEELARSKSGSPIKVLGTTPDRDYTCTVAPVTKLGAIPLSAPITVSVPPLKLPSAPTITSTEYEDGKIILAVSVSNNGGTDITGYEATCTDGANTYTGTSASSPITVSGLTNGVAYTCTVTATNSVGTSAASASTAPIIPSPKPPRVVLEEPVMDETHTGVGNLRGWAVSSDGIDKVEIHIDGSYAFDAPYGGVRTDVGNALPDVEGSENSGFSLAFNYSDLPSGTHTVSAIAHSDAGATKASAADFEVVRFDSSFISDPNAVDLSLGSCSLASDEVTLTNVTVDGSQHDLVMKWRRAEQGFELIQIDKSDEETTKAASVALRAQQSNLVAQSDSVLRVALEEPVSEEIHTGVGNLRGWAVADEGIEKIEIYIDGAYAFDAPYGGVRTDVRDAFPDVEGSGDSGFSLAFNYSDLSAGGHTIKAIAYDRLGATKESSAEFTVVRFDSSFISDLNAVDLSEGSCSLGADEVSLTDVTVDGALHDLVMKWRRAEQGFEIVEIR